LDSVKSFNFTINIDYYFSMYAETSQTEKTSVNKKKKKEQVMKNNLITFWQGKVSFVQSFWLWYFIGGSVLTIPFWLVPESAYEEEVTAILLLIYTIFLFAAIIFLMRGTWKSAEKYKKIKKREKEGSGWALAGQIYIVLHIIRIVIEFARSFDA